MHLLVSTLQIFQLFRRHNRRPSFDHMREVGQITGEPILDITDVDQISDAELVFGVGVRVITRNLRKKNEKVTTERESITVDDGDQLAAHLLAVELDPVRATCHP